MSDINDIIIIGGGPAGLTAGLYAARARLKTMLIERAVLGGQIVNSERVENYPGFPDGISGFDLIELMRRQAERFELGIRYAEVLGIELRDADKVVKTSDGDHVARAVIIAGGAKLQRLGVPGEERLVGRGVSYCATCDGPFFKGQAVAVIGGGDSAIEEALVLARFASVVYVIHRRNQLRASKILQERAFGNPQIEFIWDTVVEQILGDDRLTGITIRNIKTGEVSDLSVSGTFVYVGQRPNSGFLGGAVPLDEQGRILTDERLQTGVKGLFAAGDIRHNSPRQVITAAGDGATAAVFAERFLLGQ